MLVLLCALFLTACAGSSGLDGRLAAWVGVSEQSLVENFGRPDSVFTIDADSCVLTYVDYAGRGDASPYRGEVAYGAVVEPEFGLLDGSRDGVEYCKISFTVNNGTVVGYNFNGDDCTDRIFAENN